jgi:hypothetical protein
MADALIPGFGVLRRCFFQRQVVIKEEIEVFVGGEFTGMPGKVCIQYVS